ncbi:MAG: Lhr family helicase [Actinomycetota bacterium]
MAKSGLEAFSPAARRWFQDSFAAPTPAQTGAWKAICAGRSALVVAPTGSGKTLAAFFWSIDRLAHAPAPPPKERLRVLYISPLKALAADIERNLRSPLGGLQNTAARMGVELAQITVGTRTGDTPVEERRRFAASPPDILITTPESLFLILTSAAREALRFVETVIVDEVHALVDSKRGAHLAVSLERLDALRAVGPPAQRVGLSATVRPVTEVAAFLAGGLADGPNGGRDLDIVQPAFDKQFDLSVVVPVEDMSELGEVTGDVPVGRSAASDPQRKSIWPSIEKKLVELIRAHRSTIIFTNSRRLSERLCSRINETAGEEIARSHHGSVSKEQRRVIEEELKAGRLPAVVATSSLELGIDMGAVDLVVQVEAPVSAASGLQRVGRAGHQVGEVSRGIIFPKFRGDLVECAAVVERMKAGAIEQMHYPRNPLDVLAQQIVAMVAMDDWIVEDLERTIRGAAPFAAMPVSTFHAVLDMLSGLYPSDAFGELKPRINWDREAGILTARRNAQHLAVTSGGTIPDRGLFGVFLPGSDSARVGELDEQMVYESRVTEVFALGASSWRIEEITHDRVIVTPAPGEPAKMPFWKGDAEGRPVELGRALGRFMREVIAAEPATREKRLEDAGLDSFARSNLVQYLEEQRAATGQIPDDKTIVIEKFRDELGDWRVCVHSTLGAKVHAPWALAIKARVAERMGFEVQTMHSDDGIVIRFPDGLGAQESLDRVLGELSEAPGSLDMVLFEPEEIEALVTAEIGGSALFASRFRECAARALLLPRRQPDRRTPLWQQRQRSATLLQVAAGYGSFPIILETMRECLQDVFDLPGLVELMTDLRSRKMRVVEVVTPAASPFAGSLLFGYVGAFLYEGDAPLVERRAQALSLDTAMLAELLGTAELRELIDPKALAEVELEVQRLADGRRLRNADDAHDALRTMGAMSSVHLIERGAEPSWLVDLEEQRRAIRIRIAGEERWAAIEDAARYRDALGVPLPVGIPGAFLEPVADPVGDLIGKYARSHGPFEASAPAEHLGLGVAVVSDALRRLESEGRVVRGEFRPVAEGGALEWCDSEVLRSLRRRSMAKLRKEVEAAPPEVLGRFLPAWQGVLSPARGPGGLLRVIEQLQGARVPASALESLVLPARIAGYSPAMLDQLSGAGDVIWAGSESLGQDDGWISLYLAQDAAVLLPPGSSVDLSENSSRLLEALSGGGAMFFRQIQSVAGISQDQELLDALWDLVWAGLITNDTIAPLRALIRGRRRARAHSENWRRGGRRRGGLSLPAAESPAQGAGRWSLLPTVSGDQTRRAHAQAEQLLDRHGVVTRGGAMSERAPGGFAGVYPVLKAFEEKGACRRGYFIEGLGGAQFATPGAVDRMREMVNPRPYSNASTDERTASIPAAIVLAAADPANPHGAALPWPELSAASSGAVPARTRHRPGRKAGALVVLVDGALTIYVERGGKTLLTFTEDPARLQPAVDALALAVREGSLGKLAVEKADGDFILDSPVAKAMETAGFRQTPRGLRLRA